jgi:hypothetical protein
MIATHGTYRRGAIVLDAPVSLSEGAQVHVILEADTSSERTEPPDVCGDGSAWDDSPEGARVWIEWFDALEPILTEREFRQWDAERLAEKERQKELAAQESEHLATIFR